MLDDYARTEMRIQFTWHFVSLPKRYSLVSLNQVRFVRACCYLHLLKIRVETRELMHACVPKRFSGAFSADVSGGAGYCVDNGSIRKAQISKCDLDRGGRVQV